MIEYILTSSKKLFLLLNIQISINFQLHSVARKSNNNKLIRCNHVQYL